MFAVPRTVHRGAMVRLTGLSPDPGPLELRLEFSRGTVDPPIGVVVAGDRRLGFAGWLEMLQAVAHLFKASHAGDAPPAEESLAELRKGGSV
jgi:hypothetical protein